MSRFLSVLSPSTRVAVPALGALLLLASTSASTILLASTSASTMTAEDGDRWPSFRGPDSNPRLVASDDRLPLSWSEEENVVWERDVPGLGWSSPVVWDGKVFLTTVVSEDEGEEIKKGLYFGGERLKPSDAVHHWRVLAFDAASGEKLWDREVHTGPPEFPRHLKNTYASETPVVDGERVVAYFGNVGVWAFDHDGEELWHRGFEPKATRFGWGTAASPALYDGRVIIVNDNDDQSRILVLDAATGEELWSRDRDEGTNWAPPYVWETEERTEVVTAGSDRVRSYSLEDGEILWTLEGMSNIAIPQPFEAGGLLLVTSGYIGDQLRPVYAIRPGAKGDISLAEGETSNRWIAWSQPTAGPYNPTPLVYGGTLYTLLDRGFVTAHDAETGKEIYSKHRIERGASAFTVSPWAYNGHVFLMSEDCVTYVLRAGETFEIVGRNELRGMCMSSPAIVDGALIVRTDTRLLRLGEEESGEETTDAP